MVEKTIVADVIRKAKKTKMQLNQFFISWNGVPTLAYQGYPPSLLNVKKEINDRLPGLREENEGTKWPKTTLGALRDDRTLSWEEMFRLREICDSCNSKLQGLSFEIDELSIVLFHCRSLERRISSEIVPMIDPREAASPSNEEIDGVTKVMNQFTMKSLVDYFPKIQQPGNRESHYRAPFVEATLVYDLRGIPDPVFQFRADVDTKLPGMYCWFEDDSLHMTVRALA